jgi:hypothetical protein
MSWAVDSGFAAFLSGQQLDSVLSKLNKVYPGMWNSNTPVGPNGFKRLLLKQFQLTHMFVRVDPDNWELIGGEVYGLSVAICKRRYGLGVQARERLPPPALYGLSLSCLPQAPGEESNIRQAWLHLSGEPVVFGHYDRDQAKFAFSVPLGALEAIVDALANAPKEEEVVFRA